LVSTKAPFATALAQGRSTATGRHFNLAVLLDGESGSDGRPMGRALAESTFHHFADYNWDLRLGAPSFVTEPPGTQIQADPARLEVFKDYVGNIADWLQPRCATGTIGGTVGGEHAPRLPREERDDGAPHGLGQHVPAGRGATLEHR
jgi:hypothetical protein